jgi:peptide/nickel transport system permease protein
MSSNVRKLWKSLQRSPVALAGFMIVVLVVLLALFGTLIVPHDPVDGNLRARFMPPGFADDTGTYLLGTDQLGRDIFSRMIVGSSVSVLVGVVAVFIGGTIGVLLGLVAGFFGGWIDNLIMRVADGLLSIPFIILVVAISGILSPGLGTLILILGLTGWVTYARVIRAEVLKVREMEYVIAAYAIGQYPLMVMLRHILPASQIGVTILAESSLSFLGLGVKSPTVTWGLMLADGRQYINSAWWMTTFPGLAIAITVLGVTFLGDWLRDVLDPSMRGRD